MELIKNIELKINQLSPGLMGELDQYLDYLIKKKDIRLHKKLKQDWAGELKDVKMTSLELQKKSLDWRIK